MTMNFGQISRSCYKISVLYYEMKYTPSEMNGQRYAHTCSWLIGHNANEMSYSFAVTRQSKAMRLESKMGIKRNLIRTQMKNVQFKRI